MKLSFFFLILKKKKRKESEIILNLTNSIHLSTTWYSWKRQNILKTHDNFFLDIIRQNHIELIHWCFTLYFIIISQYLNVLEVSQTNVLGIFRTCSGAVSNGISFFFSLQFYRSTTPIRSGTAYNHVSTMIFQMHKQRVYSRSNKF